MNQLKYGKKGKFMIALLTLALLMCLSVVFAAILNSGLFNARADVGGRVTVTDLMGRYPVDYVVGPVDVKSEDINEKGQYEYKDTNFELDTQGNPVVHSCAPGCDHQVATYNGSLSAYKGKTCILTNNTYGIPASQYFNVETYIYTEDEKDESGKVIGRVLYGWQPNIQAVESNGKKIAENGKIMDGVKPSEVTGIHVAHNAAQQTFSTTGKYVLIVPKDIVRVGKGNAAYVYDGISYYEGYTAYSTRGEWKAATANDGAKFTDFGSFIYSSVAWVPNRIFGNRANV